MHEISYIMHPTLCILHYALWVLATTTSIWEPTHTRIIRHPRGPRTRQTLGCRKVYQFDRQPVGLTVFVVPVLTNHMRGIVVIIDHEPHSVF